MSDITVTLPKKEYDKLEEFHDKIKDGEVSICYDRGHYDDVYCYRGLESTIEAIKDRDSKYIDSLLMKATAATDKTTCLEFENKKLKDEIVKKDETISSLRLLYDDILNKKPFWRFWK